MARPRSVGRGWLGVLALLCGLISATGCQREIIRPDRDTSTEGVTAADLSSVASIPTLLSRGFEYGSPPDGQSQKFYYVPGGRGQVYESMLKEFLPDAELKVKSFPEFLKNQVDANNSNIRTKGGLDLLFVQARHDHLDEIEDFINTLETSVPQVEIEAKIAEVFISEGLEVGTTSSFTEQDFNELTLFDSATSRFNTGSFLQSLTSGSASGFQGGIVNFGTIQDETLINVVLEALARKENTEIIAQPSLRVLSGFTATVITGERTPVQTARIVNNTVTVDTKFEQTGIQLQVTPLVIGQDDVQMHVKPEVSVVTGFTDPATSAGVSSPIISTRNAETIVMVKNGHSLVLGGLTSKTIVDVESRIPILGSIPLLKHLFRTVRKEKATTRLYFIITPRITNDQGQYGGNILYPPEDG